MGRSMIRRIRPGKSGLARIFLVLVDAMTVVAQFLTRDFIDRHRLIFAVAVANTIDVVVIIIFRWNV